MVIELLSVLMIKGQKTNRYLSASKGARRNAEMAFKGFAKGWHRLVTALFRHALHTHNSYSIPSASERRFANATALDIRWENSRSARKISPTIPTWKRLPGRITR